MSHVLCHDVAAYGSGRAKHDQNGNQLVVGEAKADCHRKEDCGETDQLQEGTGNGGLQSGERFSEMECAAHCHQAQGSGCFSQVVYRAS